MSDCTLDTSSLVLNCNCIHLPEILGTVAFVEDDDSVEVLPAPVQQLLQPRLVLVLRALRLPDQRRVRRVDDALAHIA